MCTLLSEDREDLARYRGKMVQSCLSRGWYSRELGDVAGRSYSKNVDRGLCKWGRVAMEELESWPG